MPESSAVQAIASPVELPHDRHRVVTHFFATPDSTGMTIQIAGGASIELEGGQHYLPTFGIMSAISVTGDGSIIVS